MYALFYVTIFASQLRFFRIGGFQITPVRVALVALILVDLITHRGKLAISRKNNIWFYAMLIWNCWALLSFFWAEDKSSLMRTEIVLFEAFALIYYAQRLINTKERAAAAIISLLAPCILHNALGWLEITRKIYLFSKYTELYSKQGYPVSIFTNTNNFGLYLALISIILLGVIFVSENRLLRMGSAALLASSIFLLFRTGSRGAIIANVLAIIVFFLLLRKSLKFAVGVGVVLVAVSVLMIVNPSLFDNLEQMYQQAFRVNLDAVSGSDFYRVNMLQNGMDFLNSTYGMGIGPGNVEHWMKNYGTRFTNHVNNIHNWWIEILVSSGVVVFGAVIVAWLATYRKLIMKYLSGFNRNAISALIAFGIAFAIGCISPSTLYMAEWPWFMLGLFFFFAQKPELLDRPVRLRRKKVSLRIGLAPLRTDASLPRT